MVYVVLGLLGIAALVVFYMFFVVAVPHPDGAVVERLRRPVRAVQSGPVVRLPGLEVLNKVDGGQWKPVLPIERVPTRKVIRDESTGKVLGYEPGAFAFCEIHMVLEVARTPKGWMDPSAMAASLYSFPGDSQRDMLTQALSAIVREAVENYVSTIEAEDLNQPMVRQRLKREVHHRIAAPLRGWGYQVCEIAIVELSSPELVEAATKLQKSGITNKILEQEAEGLVNAVKRVKSELGDDAGNNFAWAETLKRTGMKANVTTLGEDVRSALAGLLASGNSNGNGKP